MHKQETPDESLCHSENRFWLSGLGTTEANVAELDLDIDLGRSRSMPKQ